jgi:hypothetical protein
VKSYSFSYKRSRAQEVARRPAPAGPTVSPASRRSSSAFPGQNTQRVHDNTWIAGLGYKAAGQILDDIAASFKV